MNNLHEIIEQVDEAYQWIYEVAGPSDRDQEHIQKMLLGLTEASDVLKQMNELSTNGKDLIPNQ